VANEGVFIAIVSPEIADEVVQVLRGFECCERASKIGAVTQEHPAKVLLQSGIGGRRVVNMLAGEQLPRIC
jgi:hydrogenase expression/formation protein HypE